MIKRSQYIQLRVSRLEKAMIMKAAQKTGQTTSDFIRNACFNVKLYHRMSDEEIEAYTSLSKYVGALQSISNYMRKSHPNLSAYVQDFVDELKTHLNK